MRTNPSSHNPVVQQLISLLTEGQAHATIEHILKDLPFEHAGIVPDGLPYSIWQLVEHIRIAQWDILEFSRDAKHQSPKWPDEYWPAETAPTDEQTWHYAIAMIKRDRDTFISLLTEPNVDLYTPFEHGSGQNLFREALLIADHNSYHLGQLVILRRLLQDWQQ
ncbi:DinB family protein [Segetibacter sp. 3557_3]|uniref:DinB family protein n=1 Tax=Segetibacter sp. 3557_3 TaxID=2547429 RepID=UPI0010586311|nr:DinB family protein [Segetibacter sp. 3557_3]TDH25238.1 DinB family protein [Segetibacter sp. 3557_3]